jgi:hypothetical protein
MEHTDLMLGEGVNRLRSGRLSRHRPDGESIRMPEDRMLWRGNALKRFAHFATINSVLSNADEFTLKSCHVVGLPLQKQSPMTGPDGASELPHSNEGCKTPQGGAHRTQTARGPAVAELKYGSLIELQRHCVTCV